MKRVLVLLLLAGLAGCVRRPGPGLEVTRTELLTREVPVSSTLPTPSAVIAPPVAPPRACVARRVGPPPAYPDQDEALREAPSIYEQVQLLLAGRRMRMARERELADALRDCAPSR